MIRWLIFGVIISPTLIMSLAGAPARADDLPQAVSLVTVSGYPPFADPALTEGGLAVELVRQSYAAVGVTATITYSTWDLAYDAMLSANYLGAFPFRRTAEREAAALFSDPIFVVRQQAISAATRPVLYTGPDSVKGLKPFDSKYSSSPKIWEERAKFDAEIADFAKIVSAAQSKAKDVDTLKAMFQPIGRQCGSCHEDFRQKDG